MMRRATLLIAWGLTVACAAPRQTPPPAPVAPSLRVHRLEELNATEVTGLDRERTLFLLPVGMVEVHGPHLPIGSDTLGLDFETTGISTRVAQQLPDWTVVRMPTVNYGQGGANEIGGLFTHPGTYAIRQATLRALVADLGGQIAQNGFKWLFVTSGHGAPTHNQAIDDACDFVSEAFGIQMLPLHTVFGADASIQKRLEEIQARHFPEADRKAWGLDVHAGVSETSSVLAVRPDLVAPVYKTLPPYPARSVEELAATAARPGWPGYFSMPAQASVEYGRDFEAWWIEGLSDLIVRATKGETLRPRPAPRGGLTPAQARMLGPALANERAFESKLNAWLSARAK